MVRKLIEWAVGNPLIVVLLALALAGFGVHAFLGVNVEAYPDPAPPILEVVAQYPGASAEEVERQVTIPLEVALAGMPGLEVTRSKSLFGLAFVNNQFQYGLDYNQARQEVINRLRSAELPADVSPEISPRSPIGEIFRFTLSNPRDPLGRPIYTLNDLKTLLNWTLVREFRRIPGIIDVISFGGTRKRYEVRPDPSGSSATGSRSPSCRSRSPRATPTSAATTWSRARPSRWSAGSVSSAGGRIRSSASLA